MSQSNCLRKDLVGLASIEGAPRLKIKVPKFDNSGLIKGYSKTLIGRCMNPPKQNMAFLLHMMPELWHVEERVVGADLGMGKFQIDFDHEDDIVEVMKMEPFHFDGWMVSLVRWEPVMDPSYPSAITFWIKIFGVPLQFWAAETFTSIGESLGVLREIDIDNGRIKVTVDGFKPLFFESVMEFADGEEPIVKFKYERLHGVCELCWSLCHGTDSCPFGVPEKLVGKVYGSAEKETFDPDGEINLKALSYKAALQQDQGSVQAQHPNAVFAKRDLNFDDSEKVNAIQQNHGNNWTAQNGLSWHQKGKGKQVAPKSMKEKGNHGKRYGYAIKKNHKKVGETSKANQTGLEGFDGWFQAKKSPKSPVIIASVSSKENGAEESLSHLFDREQKMVQDFVKELQPYLETSKDVMEIFGNEALISNDPVSDAVGNASALETVIHNNELPEGEDLSYLFDLIEEAGELVETKEYDGSENGDLLESMKDKGHGEEMAFTVSEEKKEDKEEPNLLGQVKKKLVRGGTVLAGASSKKRLAQILVSPRRKSANKNAIRIGKGLYSKNKTGKKI